ncbi:class I tRNA ligase family protein, partial [Candidatus Gracilibacteria bacterium]|nr:class I tRNA ligase family protein [Candidatus Gracilibacteria bacterium]
TYRSTVEFFEKLLRLLHPFMPFITEELWQNLDIKSSEKSIMISKMPSPSYYEPQYINSAEICKEAIVNIRSIRQSKNISPKESLLLFANKDAVPAELFSFINKMANIKEILPISQKEVNGAGASFMIGTIEFFIPLDNYVNKEEEIVKIEEELKRLNSFLNGVNKKLENQKFVESAPKDVVELEYKKQKDAITKIEKLLSSREELIKSGCFITLSYIIEYCRWLYYLYSSSLVIKSQILVIQIK